MANEASIVIPVELDDKQAKSELNRLNHDMLKLQQSMSANQEKKSSIEAQLKSAQAQAEQTRQAIIDINTAIRQNNAVINSGGADKAEYDIAQATVRVLNQELEVENAQLKQQEATVSRLNIANTQIDGKLREQNAQYGLMKAQVGAIEKGLINTGAQAMPDIRKKVHESSTAVKKSIGIILKYGLGIRSVYMLFRKLASALVEGIKAFSEYDSKTRTTINGLKASLQGLKGSWGAAFAPIVNTVAPLLQTLIGWLTSAANAVARFFAVLGGKSSYKRAVSNQEALADSISGTGGAAEKAQKQLAGFDEITRLDDNSGGGGGGSGADSLKYIEEAIDHDSFASQLAFSVKDVLFDWSELTPEQIAEKCVAGIPMLAGAVMGGIIGGVPGVIIGALAGLTLGLVSDAIIFNHDGKLSKDEILKSICTILGGAVGGAIGFAVGGVAGAAIGATLGIALELLASKISFGYGGGDVKATWQDWLRRLFVSVIGGVIGFANGGAAGAAIGIAIGFGLSLELENIGFFSKVDDLAHRFKVWFWDEGIMVGVEEVKTLFNTAAEELSNFVNVIKDYFKQRIEKWKEVLPDDTSGVGAAIIFGILEGILDAMIGIGTWVWEHIFKPIWDGICDAFQIHSPSKVMLDVGKNIVQGMLDGITDKWNTLTGWLEQKWNNLKSWWQGLSLGTFDFKTPHLQVAWEDIGVDSILARFLGISALPHLSVSWYARGGIVDGATLIGAGEAGKEAIIPLERNTEWITKVASELASMLFEGKVLNHIAEEVAKIPDALDRFSVGIANIPMPAMATGSIIPPRVVISGYDNGLNNDILDRLDRLSEQVEAIFNKPDDRVTNIDLDGKRIAEVVTSRQRNAARSTGR